MSRISHDICDALKLTHHRNDLAQNPHRSKPRLAIAGGSGFLGHLLAAHFSDKGWDVVILTRNPVHRYSHAREAQWDGKTMGPWSREVDGARAVINLAGRSVNCRYHARNRRAMMDSRTDSTRVLGEAIAACANPPQTWLNASTATIYRHTFGPPWDERGEIGATAEAKDAFSIEVATAWEHAFEAVETPQTRKVALRTAMVFGLDAAHNNVFRVLRRLARWGLGGRMGHGRQFVSWIHESDFCRAIEWILDHEEIKGVINVAAPNPLPNTEMMRLFREICGVPFGLPAAAWMLELGAFFLRTETELIIKSRRVIPGKLLAGGFEFQFPEMKSAVRDLENRLAGHGQKNRRPEGFRGKRHLAALLTRSQSSAAMLPRRVRTIKSLPALRVALSSNLFLENRTATEFSDRL